MQVSAEKIDKALHLIPVAINHLKSIELELLSIRQTILTSIEDETDKKEDNKNDRQTH